VLLGLLGLLGTRRRLLLRVLGGVLLVVSVASFLCTHGTLHNSCSDTATTRQADLLGRLRRGPRRRWRGCLGMNRSWLRRLLWELQGRGVLQLRALDHERVPWWRAVRVRRGWAHAARGDG
jgi:hypothetical protein